MNPRLCLVHHNVLHSWHYDLHLHSCYHLCSLHSHRCNWHRLLSDHPVLGNWLVHLYGNCPEPATCLPHADLVMRCYTLVSIGMHYHALVRVGTFWYALLHVGTCWYTLVHVGTCCKTLVLVVTCWYLLVLVGKYWYVLLHSTISSPTRLGTKLSVSAHICASLRVSERNCL